MKIRDLLDRDLTALDADCTVAQAEEVFYQHHTTGLPVVDSMTKVIGFLSEKDILKAALPEYFSTRHFAFSASFLPDYGQLQRHLQKIRDLKVVNFMQSKVISFKEDDSDFYAASELIRLGLKLAPVVDGEDFLKGIISRSQLIRSILSKEEQQRENLPTQGESGKKS